MWGLQYKFLCTAFSRREMWAHPTEQQGMCWWVGFLSFFCVCLFFPVTFGPELSLWAKWQSLRVWRVTFSGERSRLMASRPAGHPQVQWSSCTREADRGHCEAAHCQLQGGSQWQEWGKHWSQPQEGQGRRSGKVIQQILLETIPKHKDQVGHLWSYHGQDDPDLLHCLLSWAGCVGKGRAGDVAYLWL